MTGSVGSDLDMYETPIVLLVCRNNLLSPSYFELSYKSPICQRRRIVRLRLHRNHLHIPRHSGKRRMFYRYMVGVREEEKTAKED